MRLKDDFFTLNYGVDLCSSVGEWGEGNESRAFCTLSHLECSQTGCPEVADSLEMAAAGTGCEVEDRVRWFLLPACFIGPVRELGKSQQWCAWMALTLDLVFRENAESPKMTCFPL